MDNWRQDQSGVVGEIAKFSTGSERLFTNEQLSDFESYVLHVSEILLFFLH